MKTSVASAFVAALAAYGAIASSWFVRPVYNKWHETELDRWLNDYNIPHPDPSDRKDLENLVKNNWNDKVVTPYKNWDAQTLQNYLVLRGQRTEKSTEKYAEPLTEQVREYWTETEESANHAYANVRDWIFDTWTDSQLKAFADKHGIPVPQARERDTLLKAVRENYQSAANKLSEYSQYPGDWLYGSWSNSDLKAWFDERGWPVPQPSSRDNLIASLRRNSRLASLNMQAAYASASLSAAAAQQSLSDALFDSWSDSQLKAWADKNGIKVPQGSKRNELLALARRHRAHIQGKGAADSAASTYGAATSKAGNAWPQATNGFVGYTDWIKAQLGIATGYEASASSASASASKSASSATSTISKSAQKDYDAAASSAKAATGRIKEEL